MSVVPADQPARRAEFELPGAATSGRRGRRVLCCSSATASPDRARRVLSCSSATASPGASAAGLHGLPVALDDQPGDRGMTPEWRRYPVGATAGKLILELAGRQQVA